MPDWIIGRILWLDAYCINHTLAPTADLSPLGHGHGLQYGTLTMNRYKKICLKFEKLNIIKVFFMINIVTSTLCCQSIYDLYRTKSCGQ